MSNLLDFINSITVDAEQDIKSYVYYNDDTGKIHKISSRNNLLKDYKILEVPYNDVKEIMSGRKRTDDFRVEYDTALKQLALKEQNFEDAISSINDKLYKIPENNDPTVDLKIINDRKNNFWKILLNPDLRKNKHFLQRPGRVNLHFSITAKNDPNILYYTFVVNLKDLIEKDFVDIDNQIDFDSNIKELSIYTAKYLDTYAYELIPNE